MQLYKRRDFGALFSDTITFFKKNGAHYFKNYFAFTGIPYLFMGVASYFFFRYYMIIMEYSTGTATNFVETGDSIGFLLSLVIFSIVAVLFGVYNYSYTAIYMILYSEHQKNFGFRDIMANFRSRLKRIIVFSLVLILMMIILLVPLAILMAIMVVTIIGILAVPLLISFLYIWLNNSFMEYISTTSKISDSLNFGFSIARENFWKSVGSVTIIYVIMYIVTSILIAVPMYVYIFSQAVSNIESASAGAEFFGTLILFYVLGFILQILAGLVLQTNANIIYYSLIEAETNVSTFEEIDQIGNQPL